MKRETVEQKIDQIMQQIAEEDMDEAQLARAERRIQALQRQIAD